LGQAVGLLGCLVVELLCTPAQGKAGLVQLGSVHGHRRLVGQDAQHRQVRGLGVAFEPVQPYQTADDLAVEGHRHADPTASIDHLA